MTRLTGADVFHLAREASGVPAHTVKVAILAPGDGPLDPDALFAWLASCLPERAPFRWRLLQTPLRLGRPVWVDAETVSPDDHLRRRTVAEGDTDRSLEELVGELAGGPPLPRDRPLWRLWVVDGLSDGRLAIVLQLHHALADGVASVRIWEELFAPGEQPPAPAAVPHEWALVRGALRHHCRALRDLPSLLRRLRASEALQGDATSDAVRATSYLEAPAASINGTLSRERACRFVGVPLSDLRDIGSSLGGTVNDVFCAICSGAVRAYLLERNELPSESLTATAPVALERDAPGYGNVMTSWFWTLGTDEADPGSRFRTVRDSLRAARELQAADPRLIFDLQEHRGLYETAWKLLSRAERRRGRPMLNLVTSNVHGPGRLGWEGHPVVGLSSVGPLTGRMGLNLTAWSYDGTFTIGLHADRHLVPDLARMADLVRAEVEQLRATAAAPSSGSGSGSGSAA